LTGNTVNSATHSGGFRPPNPEFRKKWPISAELPGRFQPNWVAGFVRIAQPICFESRKLDAARFHPPVSSARRSETLAFGYADR